MSDIEKLESKLDNLADSIKDLALAVTENVAENKHIIKTLSEQAKKQEALEERILTLELVQAGETARNEIWNHARKVVVGLIATAIVGGALMMFYSSK